MGNVLDIVAEAHQTCRRWATTRRPRRICPVNQARRSFPQAAYFRFDPSSRAAVQYDHENEEGKGQTSGDKQKDRTPRDFSSSIRDSSGRTRAPSARHTRARRSEEGRARAPAAASGGHPACRHIGAGARAFPEDMQLHDHHAERKRRKACRHDPMSHGEEARKVTTLMTSRNAAAMPPATYSKMLRRPMVRLRATCRFLISSRLMAAVVTGCSFHECWDRSFIALPPD